MLNQISCPIEKEVFMRSVIGWGIVGLVAAILATGSVQSAIPDVGVPVETTDAKGRVVSRTISDSDKSGHRTLNVYFLEGDKPAMTTSEDFDASGHTTKRTVERFDRAGRVLERRDVAIDRAGHESGTLTTFVYDQEGPPRQTTTPIP
jgi:hypothetical protein